MTMREVLAQQKAQATDAELRKLASDILADALVDLSAELYPAVERQLARLAFDNSMRKHAADQASLRKLAGEIVMDFVKDLYAELEPFVYKELKKKAAEERATYKKVIDVGKIFDKNAPKEERVKELKEFLKMVGLLSLAIPGPVIAASYRMKNFEGRAPVQAETDQSMSGFSPARDLTIE